MTLIVGSLVWLAVGGVRDTKTYYKTIPELAKMGDSAQSQRLRVGGDVKPGSIVKSGMQVSFVLYQEVDNAVQDKAAKAAEGPHTLNVVYRGTDPLPDTFRDNAIALADGHMGSDGVFIANKVQAKCASKYEPKTPQRNMTHETAGQKISSLRLPSNQ